MFAVLKEAGKVGEKICVCLRLGKHVPLFDVLQWLHCGCLALLRRILNSAARKMWV